MSSNDVTSEDEMAIYGRFGATITHKIRRVTTDEKGRPCFVTYGTTTGKDDMATVGYGDVYAKYMFKIPLMGHFFNFIKTTPGYFVCILIPFLIIIVLQILNFVKVFRKYRAEQMSEMREERSKLEEDKKANEKMMEELLALKAELERARSGGDPEKAEEKSAGGDTDEDTAEEDKNED
jgi:membrane protein insertase Oxa1/YidC/SpoIIIJ